MIGILHAQNMIFKDKIFMNLPYLQEAIISNLNTIET